MAPQDGATTPEEGRVIVDMPKGCIYLSDGTIWMMRSKQISKKISL